MNRTGKIARLPHRIREELNRRLRDNVPGPKICQWVNRLSAAKAVCAEFAKRNGKEESPINENQLSEWRRGGFQDWLREQRLLTDTREMARWSMKLAKECGGELSEGAAVLLSGQLLTVLQGMAEVRGEKGEGRSEMAGSAGVPPGEVEPGETGRRDGGAPRRSPEAERMEADVRVLGAVGKCLSGIRNGDQNRVRLAQVDRKLAQRDKMIALERRKYDDERAEIAAQKKAERKKKRGSGLSDRGKIDYVRGRTFGHEYIIKEKEQDLKELEKDLKILKKKFGVSEGGTEESNVQCPKSNVGTASDAAAPNGSRAIPSTSEKSQGENGAKSEPEADFSPQRHRDAEAQGIGKMETGKMPVLRYPVNPSLSGESQAQGEKKFDVDEVLDELKQIGEELAALRVKVQAREGSLNGSGAETGGSKIDPPSPATAGSDATGDRGLPIKPVFSTPPPPLYGGIGYSEEWRRAAKKFEEWSLNELARLKKDVAALKAEVEAGGTEDGGSKMEDGGLQAESGPGGDDASGSEPDFSTHPSSLRFDATSPSSPAKPGFDAMGRREEAEAQV